MSGGAKRALALISVMAVAALFLLLQGDFRAGHRLPPIVTAPPQRTSGNAPAGATADQANAALALPHFNAPLETILEPLAARADAGDVKAACRLAMELIRCENVTYYLSIPAFRSHRQESAFESTGDLDAADRAAEAELEQLRIAQECRAVPVRLRDKAPQYLGQAARAGVPEAMVRYADGHFWPPDGRGIYSDPEFDRWRRDAEGLLHRAIAAGVPEAPFILLMSHQGDFHGVSSLIRDDPVKAEALHQLMVRLHGWKERPAASSLDPQSRARAHAMAKQWHEGPFGGRRYHGQDRSLFQLAGFPRRDGTAHSFCTGDNLAP